MAVRVDNAIPSLNETAKLIFYLKRQCINLLIFELQDDDVTLPVSARKKTIDHLFQAYPTAF
jgi:hypothetical protein